MPRMYKIGFKQNNSKPFNAEVGFQALLRGSLPTVMSQSIPTGYIPWATPGVISKKLPGGSGFDF